MRSILIVDDDATSRYGMHRALEGNYRISEADGAAAARVAMKSEKPDLLLLDIEMPGETGLDLLRDLKSKDPALLVIMVTAYGSEKVAVEAMKTGAYDYIPKPFEVDELRLVVAKAFERLEGTVGFRGPVRRDDRRKPRHAGIIRTR